MDFFFCLLVLYVVNLVHLLPFKNQHKLPGRWEVEGLGGKGKGMKTRKLVVSRQSRDVQYGIGAMVSITIMAVCSARWVLE